MELLATLLRPRRDVARVACVAIAAVFALAPAAASASHVEPLRGQWNLDAFGGAGPFVTVDSSAHQDLQSGTSPTLVAGRFGNALSGLTAASVPGTAAAAADLETPHVTLLAWVKNAGAPPVLQYLAAKGGMGCVAASYAMYTGYPGGPGTRFYVYDGVSNYSSAAANDAVLWDGGWHLVAGTFDGQKVRLYVDGAEAGTGSPGGGAISYALPSRKFFAGDYDEAQCPGGAFGGNLDEVRVYSRALTSSELTRLANAPGPTPPVLEADVPPDVTPPDTVITSGPAEGAVVGDAPPAFAFAASEPGARFECRTYDPATRDLIARTFKPCASPYERLDLIKDIALGEQSFFEVRAIDAAHNADPTPARRGYRKHGKLGVKPPPSKCQPVKIATVHGKGVRSNCRIVEIKRGKVPCVNIQTYKVRKCPFKARTGRSRTGSWIKAKKTGKKYALVGRFITLKGRHRGVYAIAAPVGNPKASPCGVAPKASSSDNAPASLGSSLATACIPETVNAATNASGLALDNYATRTVCGSDFSQADVSSSTPVESPAPGISCYTAEGAGLNDPNGTERDINQRYMAGSARCHVIISNGVEVYAAKRPAVVGIPARVDPKSKVVWRPVSPLRIAN